MQQVLRREDPFEGVGMRRRAPAGLTPPAAQGGQWFLVRNSWGAAWGMKGYFTMPYSYLIQAGLSRDFWTIRLVGQ